MQDKPSPYEQVITDASGEYQLAVLPGPGSLAVSAGLSGDATAYYQKAKAEDFGLPANESGLIATTNGGYLSPEQYEAAAFVDFSANENPVVNLQVTRLSDVIQVRCVDGRGNRIKTVEVAGRLRRKQTFDPFPYDTETLGTTIEILELGLAGRRPVVLRESQGRLAVAIFAPDDARRPHLSDIEKDDLGVCSITLNPAGAISGRFVKRDGSPVTDAKVVLVLADQQLNPQRFIEFPKSDVDAEGRFNVKGLPATGPYVLGIESEERSGLLTGNIQIVPARNVDVGSLDVSEAMALDEFTRDAASRDKP